MPFDDNTFDNITTVETYYFWPDKENDVKEVFRVLKQGGTVMLLLKCSEQTMIRSSGKRLKIC